MHCYNWYYQVRDDGYSSVSDIDTDTQINKDKDNNTGTDVETNPCNNNNNNNNNTSYVSMKNVQTKPLKGVPTETLDLSSIEFITIEPSDSENAEYQTCGWGGSEEEEERDREENRDRDRDRDREWKREKEEERHRVDRERECVRTDGSRSIPNRSSPTGGPKHPVIPDKPLSIMDLKNLDPRMESRHPIASSSRMSGPGSFHASPVLECINLTGERVGLISQMKICLILLTIPISCYDITT